jgi:phosphoribosylformylglycinamidine (FGAM) synthase PurS component
MPKNLTPEEARQVWQEAIKRMDVLDATHKLMSNPVIYSKSLDLDSQTHFIGLLLECAREMDGAAADIDIFANPVIEKAGGHPLALRPEALRNLAEKIRKVLGGPDA